MNLLFLLLTQIAYGQVGPEVQPQFFGFSKHRVQFQQQAVPKNNLPNIVLIGYWPPTNEMVREFSPRFEKWIGENWEGLGYNIISFHPEFPNEEPQGVGDFEVDYQDTSSDYWRLIPPLKPVILLSFGRSYENKDWEIEMATRNLSVWRKDYVVPYRPEVSPPDPEFERDAFRQSQFPGQAVVKSIRNHVPELNPFTDHYGAGEFLCEFLGFHLSWYLHLNTDHARFAAHTHIGYKSDLTHLKKGLKVMLRSLIKELDNK